MRMTTSLSSLGRPAGRLHWAAHALVLLVAVCLVPAALGADNEFVGGGTDPSDWFEAANWSEGAVPFAGDSTKIYNSFTVNITAGDASYGDKDLSIGDSDSGETATLNISDGTLNGTGTGNDIRLGVGDDQSGSLGRILQTGGAVTAVDYIKMSNGGQQAAAGSHYQISGGSLNVVDQLEMGRDDGVVQNMIQFEVIGTGPTSITIEDVKVNRIHSLSPAHASFAFTIDGTATGVTSIDVNDELQLGNSETTDDTVGRLYLELSLSAVPTNNDIVLFNAKRITMDEQFEGLPDGSDVSATFGPDLYTWTINYFDGHADSQPAVVLSNLRVNIPEPGSMVLLAMAAIPFAIRRRRGAGA
jgi:hypothetical protein